MKGPCATAPQLWPELIRASLMTWLAASASWKGQSQRHGRAPIPQRRRSGSIEGELRALSESVGILGRRGDEIASAAREARQRADAAAAGVTDLTQKVTPSALGDVKKMDRGLQDALSRLAAVEGTQKKLESDLAKPPDNRDQSARLALAATALTAAAGSGQPFVSELAAVKSLGVPSSQLASLSLLRQPVCHDAALAREFAALCRGSWQRAERPSRMAASSKSCRRMPKSSCAFVQSKRQGNDTPPCGAGRQDLQRRISGALAELDALPRTLRRPPSLGSTRPRPSTAVESSRRLATDALAGLSK